MKRFFFPAILALMFVLTACGHDEPCEVWTEIIVNTAEWNSELVLPLEMGYTANIANAQGGEMKGNNQTVVRGRCDTTYGQAQTDAAKGGEAAREKVLERVFSCAGKPVRLVSVETSAEADVRVEANVEGAPAVRHFYKIVED